MTRRFIAACENPHVNVIGHPTTRRMGKRPPVEVDFGELFRACARTGTALEINASPQRLDLPSDHIRAARDAGVKFAIDSDAHSVSDLGNMPYGVGYRAARLAHPGRRDQHLAAGPAARFPAQRPVRIGRLPGLYRHERANQAPRGCWPARSATRSPRAR